MFTSTGQYNFRLGIENFCIYLFCLHRTILTQYKNLDTYCSKFRMDREQIIEQSHVMKCTPVKLISKSKNFSDAVCK